MAGAVKAAMGDAVITFMWVFCASTLGIATSTIATALNLQSIGFASLVITTLLVAILIFIFAFIGDALGGASFNPTATAAFYAAGFGNDDLISMALRFPAQAIGALGGAVAILEAVPAKYKHQISGPSLKVDLHTGALDEGILTFAITVAVLYTSIPPCGGVTDEQYCLIGEDEKMREKEEEIDSERDERGRRERTGD